MKNNRGMSLVEVLITVAILALVIIGAATFMLTGSRSFAKGNADSGVQSEAELAVNQIEDLVIDVNGGVEWLGDDSTDEESLVMYHTEPDASGFTVHKKRIVTWYKDSYSAKDMKETIRSSEYTMSYDNSSNSYTVTSTVYENQLLASNVTDFNVDLSDKIKETGADGNDIDIVRSVVISVACLDGTGRAAYATTPLITLRNRMMLSGNPGAIFDNTPSTNDNMQLYYSSVESGTGLEAAVPIVDRVSPVYRGKMYNVFAVVNASTNVNSLCNWTIEEVDSTSALNVNGVFVVLDVDESEPNEYLTITATYKTDSSKKATGVVHVLGDQAAKGDLIACHIIPDSIQTPFAPHFGSTVEWSEFTAEEIAVLEAELKYKWSVSKPEMVEDFAKENKDLSLSIKQEEQNYGKTFRIRLEVYSPTLDKTVYDELDYVVDNATVVGGDAALERGKLRTDYGYHGDNWHWFDLPSNGQGEKNYCKITGWDYYICDANGNKMTELTNKYYDYLVFEVNCYESFGNTHYEPIYGGDRITYYITITDEFPSDVSCWVGFKIYFKYGDGTTYTYSNRHYIAAVTIMGENATVAYNSWGLTFYYGVTGYYDLEWVKNPAVFNYEFDIDYEVAPPAGVTVELLPHSGVYPENYGAGHVPDWSETTSVNGAKHFMATVNYKFTNKTGGYVDTSKIKIRGVKVHIYMKEYPSVEGYCYITYK